MYSISDLERLSGIQSHTIRMWEQRYQALTPKRSAGNTRYYDDQQLIRLLNIVTVSQQQRLKISQICSLSDEDMHSLINQEIALTAGRDPSYEFYISQLLTHGIAYDEAGFSELLSACIKQYGLRDSYLEVIYPLLTRVGLMWQKESVCAAQEHFLTNIIRQKIFVAIDALPVASASAKTWVLFLPEEEEHETGLLLSSFLLRQSGHRVIYLGGRVPFESLKLAIGANRVDRLLFFISQSKTVGETEVFVEGLAGMYRTMTTYISGSAKLISSLRLPNNIIWLKSLEELETILRPAL